MPRMEQAKDWTGLPSGSHQFAAWASALSDTAWTASIYVWALATMDLRVDTTSEEVEGLRIVREICSSDIDPARLIERDTKTHFDVLVDQDGLKIIVRFHFFGGSKKVEIHDGADPTLVELASVSDLRKYCERIRASLMKVLSTK